MKRLSLKALLLTRYMYTEGIRYLLLSDTDVNYSTYRHKLKQEGLRITEVEGGCVFQYTARQYIESIEEVRKHRADVYVERTKEGYIAGIQKEKKELGHAIQRLRKGEQGVFVICALGTRVTNYKKEYRGYFITPLELRQILKDKKFQDIKVVTQKGLRKSLDALEKDPDCYTLLDSEQGVAVTLEV